MLIRCRGFYKGLQLHIHVRGGTLQKHSRWQKNPEEEISSSRLVWKCICVVLSDTFYHNVGVKRQSNNQRTSLWTIIIGEHVNAIIFYNKVIFFSNPAPNSYYSFEFKEKDNHYEHDVPLNVW